jgi:hypothetical protein
MDLKCLFLSRINNFLVRPFNTAEYEVLSKYLKNHNGNYPPLDYITENKTKIAFWVQNQRAKYKKGNLSDDKIEKLKALPNWSW